MKPLELYKKYYSLKNFERLDLFEKVKREYGVQSVLYPGSFVHITPSLVFPEVTYIDSDRRISTFFHDKEVIQFVNNNKQYSEEAVIICFRQDYSVEIPGMTGSYDLLLSQYAGFVSQSFKKYLKTGGILVANNSHGDASMADLDDEFQLIAVYNLRNERCVMRDTDLNSYMIPKRDRVITREMLLKTRKGVGYTKNPSGYIFRKLR